jgi:hypothetical protein
VAGGSFSAAEGDVIYGCHKYVFSLYKIFPLRENNTRSVSPADILLLGNTAVYRHVTSLCHESEASFPLSCPVCFKACLIDI